MEWSDASLKEERSIAREQCRKNSLSACQKHILMGKVVLQVILIPKQGRNVFYQLSAVSNGYNSSVDRIKK